ncbi:MAG: C1 family peptidase [Bacteroidia bacterium]|nr:C1 family peptidase [Bacteroidia bacterium]
MIQFKNIFKIGLLLLGGSSLFVQGFTQTTRTNKKNGGYTFTSEVEVGNTSVKDQCRTGTCWSFSTLSFFESEIIRSGKEPVDLSEMFIVRNVYLKKAEKYVRMHGHINFAAGGAFHDVLAIIDEFGIVPNEEYTGLVNGQKKHNHADMDNVLKSYLDAIIKNDNGPINPDWKIGFNAILDIYLGKVPANFSYKGKTYTPKSFAEYLGIQAKNYIEVSSFTHHPFYSSFVIEIPDNWMWGQVYNVPLSDLEQILEYSLKNNYSIAWASDVSEKGFSFSDGLAIVPPAGWEDLSKSERASAFEKPATEQEITQEKRQLAFDNYQTQDDHGMHIVGLAKDQNNQKYYYVKNSWGSADNDLNGYFYASRNFVLYKTTCLMVNINGVPKDILKKLKVTP